MDSELDGVAVKVLITGATGFVGRRLTGILLAGGLQVVALSRDPLRARSSLPGSVEPLGWADLDQGRGVELLRDLDGVVNLAGESVVGLWTRSKRQAIRDSRVQGTRRLLAGLFEMGSRPRVIVSASAIGYYGDRGEEALVETAAPGTDFMAEICQQWEHEAMAAASRGCRVVCPRIGLVLHRSGGALGSMLPIFRMGAGGPLGDGKQWWPWIDRDDLCRLIAHALDCESLDGAVNGAAPYPVRQAEFARTLAGRLRRPAVVPAPAFALRLVLGGFSSELLSSRRTVADKLLSTGFQFQFPQLERALDNALS